jgi:hypothetical protein
LTGTPRQQEARKRGQNGQQRRETSRNLGNLTHPGRCGTQILKFGLECATIQAAFQHQGLFPEVQVVYFFSSKHALSFLSSARVAENGAQFFNRVRNRQ